MAVARISGVATCSMVGIAIAVVIARREHPLLTDLVQASTMVQNIQRPSEFLLQALTTRHVTRVSQVSSRVKRLLDAEQSVVLSWDVPSFRFFGQIAPVAN